MEFDYNDYGELTKVEVSGSEISRTAQYETETRLLQIHDSAFGLISSPQNVRIFYGMTSSSLASYLDTTRYQNWDSALVIIHSTPFLSILAFCMLVMIAAACILPLVLKKSESGKTLSDLAVFYAPMEVVLAVMFFIYVLSVELGYIVLLTIRQEFMQFSALGASGNRILSMILNFLIWFLVFAVVFWGASCLKDLFRLKGEYLKKRSLLVRLFLKLAGEGESIKEGTNTLWNRFRRFLARQYDALLHTNFRDKTNRMILKVVILNFFVIYLISLLWISSFWMSLVYSLCLLFFLMRSMKRIQNQYKGALEATNQLANGDLDTPIEGDVGIFTPVQDELKKIQTGFKKAVDEEIKSERMKSDLITNVSHDLKTPLTAIITYVDLLKSETDEEKKKEYLDVLERKSLRLKVLIEDLFEISKATSRTVTMHYVQVDIVDLLKQAGLEYEANLNAARLEMRWNLPEKKLLLWLDSERTYRIFENLIVNISKYAMPGTRVYIDLNEESDAVRVTMKNVSASELNFDTDEITDRFVRGDASRNTEGSGLGLAIAKTFTELQNGTLTISTDADLFKAEIWFPKRKGAPEEQ